MGSFFVFSTGGFFFTSETAASILAAVSLLFIYPQCNESLSSTDLEAVLLCSWHMVGTNVEAAYSKSGCITEMKNWRQAAGVSWRDDRRSAPTLRAIFLSIYVFSPWFNHFHFVKFHFDPFYIVQLDRVPKDARFEGARLDVLISRLRSYHVLISYSAECNGPTFYRTLMFLGQAGMFLPFQARCSSATHSSTSVQFHCIHGTCSAV